MLQEVKTGSPFLLLSNLLLEPSQKPGVSEPPEPRKHSTRCHLLGYTAEQGRERHTWDLRANRPGLGE